MKRRDFLASASAAVATPLALVGSARATTLEDAKEEFSHVDIEYDKPTLERYQPRLSMTTEHLKRFQYQASYVARSDEYDTYVCCYVARYTKQEGITGHDSHLGDTEPVYIFVDSGTDEPVEAVWTGWHWNAAGITDDSATFHPGQSDDPTHLSLSVVWPWGNYTYTDADQGAFFDLADWRPERELLVSGGLYDRGSAAAFEEPWVMSAAHEGRAGWWDQSGLIQGGIPPSINQDYLTMLVWETLRIRGWNSRSERIRDG